MYIGKDALLNRNLSTVGLSLELLKNKAEKC